MQQTPLKILLVGAKGTLGSAIATELGSRHQIIKASRNSSDVKINIDDPDSIRAAFEQVGMIDAVVCAAGEVEFAPLENIPPAKFDNSVFTLGIASKLMGQINLTLSALPYLRDKGSITLITGILTDEPIPMGVPASTINCAIEGFVRSAAIELPRGIRINAVSPTVLQESMPNFGSFFRGFEAIPAARAALAFSRSVEGLQTGRIYKVF